MAKGGTKVADDEATGTETVEVEVSEETSAPANAPRVREIEEVDAPPVELRGRGGGRTRTPTEFDDQVAGWNNGKWKKIPVDDSDDLKYVYNAVKRAVDAHNEDNPDSQLGVERLKQEDKLIVWVKVRPKQKRGPAVGSARIKDPATGESKVYGPGEWHTDADGNKVPNAPAETESTDSE